jgi:hypothetical protein
MYFITLFQVRASAADALVQVASSINKDDLEAYILPIIKSLSNDNTEEDHRVEAAQVQFFGNSL